MFLVECYYRYVKGKHPLQSGCSELRRWIVLMDDAYPVDQTGWAFLFSLVSLIEKGKQRNN